MKVKDIMTSDVVTIGPEASLKEVAGILAARKISGLPVVGENGEVVGIVSETDILFKERGDSKRGTKLSWLFGGVEEQVKLEARTAGEAMSAPAHTIGPGRPVAEAAARMLDASVNRLPVVDGGRLVGIVTRADLVRAFVRPDAEIEQEIRHDVLERTMWLRDPGAIRVGVVGGKVTLGGTADRRMDAELISKLVASIPGVVEIDDASLRWHEDDRQHR